MTSLNNHSPRENHGSAMVVTILLVSVMLTAALILLQRIIPYAKNVRWMNDAMQSYYTARGGVEAARHGFFYEGGDSVTAWHLPTIFGLLSQAWSPTSAVPSKWRKNVEPTLIPGTSSRISFDLATSHIIKIALPNLHTNTHKNRDYIINAVGATLPLNIKLFAGDLTPKKFGTSQRDPEYHTLNPKNLWGLRFDLRDINTASGDFGLTLKFLTGYVPTDEAILTVKIQYTAGTTIRTFTVEYDKTAGYTGGDLNLKTNLKEWVIQEIDNVGGITIETLGNGNTLSNFLDTYKCNDTDITSCSITFNLGNINNASLEPLAHFQLISTGWSAIFIPDLNAVVIGDGLSDNGLYFQRVVDLIPTRQDI